MACVFHLCHVVILVCKGGSYFYYKVIYQSWTSKVVELVRNLVAQGDSQEGKWRGNWQMEWVASTLMPPPNMVYPALLKLMRTPRLPAVDWTDTPTDLNGLVRFGERRNLVSARVPSCSVYSIHNREEWKKLPRTARNRSILQMPMKWMNEFSCYYPWTRSVLRYLICILNTVFFNR